MTNLIFWLVFGVSYPCQSASVEYPEIRMMRPDWGFAGMRHEVACEASKNVDALMITLNINPFDAVQHEDAPAELELE